LLESELEFFLRNLTAVGGATGTAAGTPTGWITGTGRDTGWATATGWTTATGRKALDAPEEVLDAPEEVLDAPEEALGLPPILGELRLLPFAPLLLHFLEPFDPPFPLLL